MNLMKPPSLKLISAAVAGILAGAGAAPALADSTSPDPIQVAEAHGCKGADSDAHGCKGADGDKHGCPGAAGCAEGCKGCDACKGAAGSDGSACAEGCKGCESCKGKDKAPEGAK
jgi:hypothetical protein